MDQTFVLESVIIDLVCSSWCPVNSFTDAAFVMAVYVENALGAAGEFFTAGWNHPLRLGSTHTR